MRTGAAVSARRATTRVTYRTEIDGHEAEELGAMVTADFPDVLAALKRPAERNG